MKVLYTGKTKDVLLDEEKNIVSLLFKDSATGENGVFDPGSNTVGGSVEGKGKIGLNVSNYFFELMEKKCDSQLYAVTISCPYKHSGMYACEFSLLV